MTPIRLDERTIAPIGDRFMIMDQFNASVHHADILTRYMMDQSTPEELYDALEADGWTMAAKELKQIGEQLGYFKNGKTKLI